MFSPLDVLISLALSSLSLCSFFHTAEKLSYVTFFCVSETPHNPFVLWSFPLSALLHLLPNKSSSTHTQIYLPPHSLFLFMIVITLSRTHTHTHTGPHTHARTHRIPLLTPPLSEDSSGALTTFPHGKLPAHTHTSKQTERCVLTVDGTIRGRKDQGRERERERFDGINKI